MKENTEEKEEDQTQDEDDESWFVEVGSDEEKDVIEETQRYLYTD